MRISSLLVLFLFLLTIGLIGCGDSGSSGGGGNNNQPSISVSPSSPSILVGQSARLTANLQNVSNTNVSWTIQEANGGTITANGNVAVYTAPWPVGTYHVVVKSLSNSALSATATISVTAAFVFMEEYPAGAATPFSMTPKIGLYATDGSFSLADVIDTGTGNPVSVAMENITLSADGTVAAFNQVTPIAESSSYAFDVYVANADGTGSPTQLTTDGLSWWPEFSADGQQIVYIRGDGTGKNEIWAMNVDGTNQHVVLPATVGNNIAYSATFSPDGSKIAAELDWTPGGIYYDGIAIMNADGSDAMPLTGGADFPCSVGWDEMPAFTHDGTQIMFSRYCDDDFSESLYVVNVDGTGLAPLLLADSGVLHYNPILVADKLVFQTNQDFVGSGDPIPFEIYSMNLDGTSATRLTNNTLFDGFDDNWYATASAAASPQPALRGVVSAKRLHGAARHAARIEYQRQHHRK